MSDDRQNGDLNPSRQVNDDENQSQSATINRIQRYRDDLAEFQKVFAEGELSDEIDERKQHRAYHHLVSGFLQLLKPYLTDSEITESQYYWEDAQLGEFTVTPPEIIQRPTRDEMDRALQRGDKMTLARGMPREGVDPITYRVEGLKDFASAKTEWEVEWSVMFGPEVSAMDVRHEIHDESVRVKPRRRRNEPIMVVKTVRLPRPIIEAAVTALENFVRSLGMDIDLSPEPYEGEGAPGL